MNPSKTPFMTGSPSPAAALTGFKNQSKVIPANFSFSQDIDILTSVFNVDPSNPYFHIFAGGPLFYLVDANDLAFNGAFSTTFQFTNGGVPVSQTTLYWGDGNALDGNPIDSDTGFTSPAVQGLVLSASVYYGPTVIAANDPESCSCPFIVPGASTNGILTQWSCLADQVRVNTMILGTQLAQPYVNTAGTSSVPFVPPFAVLGAGNNKPVAGPPPTANSGGTLYHGIIQQPWGQ